MRRMESRISVRRADKKETDEADGKLNIGETGGKERNR